MAIARRPKQNTGEQASGVNVDALIAKGGSVSAQGATETDTAAFTLRVPKALLKQLDTHLKGKPIKTNRQYWILQAVVEKLECEAG